MNWLRELGRVSYCMYLIHQIVNLFCHNFLTTQSNNGGSWKLLTVPMVASVVYLIAKLSWIYFEDPMQRRGHAFKY
jgi:peptidoglycan/LPS O-acetylase OafA/YrhL